MNSILQVIPIFVGFSQFYTLFLYNMASMAISYQIISVEKMNNEGKVLFKIIFRMSNCRFTWSRRHP